MTIFRSYKSHPLATGLMTAAVLVAGGGAYAASHQVMQGLRPGLWSFKEVGAPATQKPKSLCLSATSSLPLVQIEHGGAACPAYVLEDGAARLGVSYDCGARGHGVTHVRVETRQLLQLNTQGIKGDAPFARQYEGRWAGQC